MEPDHAPSAVEHAAGTVPAGGDTMVFPPFTQVSTFVSQIFWLGIAFAILYVAVAYVFLPRIRKALAERDGQIAKDVAAAAAASQSAEAAVKELEAGMNQARARARDTAAQARAAADRKIAEATTAEEARLAVQLAEAEKKTSAMRAAAMANVAAVAEDAASAITEKLIGVKPSAASAKAAVARALGA